MTCYILHADDEPSILELFKKFLEKYDDFRVSSALNSDDFLFKAFFGNYDVFIVDYIIYPLNGLEILSELRSKGIDTPFILLTGKFKDHKVISHLIKFPFCRYIQKMLDFQSLIVKVVNNIKCLLYEKREILLN